MRLMVWMGTKHAVPGIGVCRSIAKIHLQRVTIVGEPLVTIRDLMLAGF